MRSWWALLSVLTMVTVLTGLKGGAIPDRATNPRSIHVATRAVGGVPVPTARPPSRLLMLAERRTLPTARVLNHRVVPHTEMPSASHTPSVPPISSRPVLPPTPALPTSTASVAAASSAKPWVLGYYTQYSSNSVASQSSLAANLHTITAIAPLWYTYRANGSLHRMGYHRAIVRAYAASHGIGVYPLVTNAGTNDTILTNASIRNQVVASLTQLAVRDNYPGFNIDFEGLNYWDRQGMSAFVMALAHSLHPLGKVVTVAVIPKTVTDPYGRAYDFRVLGQYADKVVLMTYDHHDIGSPAGPVAPMGWVTQAVDYALTRMPAQKIVLGLAVYGYNWGSNGTTVEVHDLQAVHLAAAHGVPIQWNPADGESTFTYTSAGVNHTVWFENGYSDAAKIALATANHLGGVAIWRLGDEDPHLWTVLQQFGY